LRNRIFSKPTLCERYIDIGVIFSFSFSIYITNFYIIFIVIIIIGDWHCAYVLLYGPKILKVDEE